MRTVVVGLGNPILSDDSVGIKVAARVRERLAPGSGVEVVEAYAGGLRLMEAISGFARAIVVDAVKSGDDPAGTVRTFPLHAAAATRNTLCAHDGDLATVLKLGSELGLELPGEVAIVGIEAVDVETFGEELSDAVRAAVPEAVAVVLRILDTPCSTVTARIHFCGFTKDSDEVTP